MADNPLKVMARSSSSRAIIFAVPICSFSLIARAALIICRKAGVPPSSLDSMLSTYLYSPHGLVQSTVPPPGWSGTDDLYNDLSNSMIPDDPGPPRNLCGEKKMASSFSIGSSGCMFMSTYGAEAAKSMKQRPPCSCIMRARV